MREEYNKGKTVALIKEGQEIMWLLRAETESLKRQMSRVLEGGEDDSSDDREATHNAGNLQERAVAKSFWQFWRCQQPEKVDNTVGLPKLITRFDRRN